MDLGRIKLKSAWAGGSQKVDRALLLMEEFEPKTKGSEIPQQGEAFH